MNEDERLRGLTQKARARAQARRPRQLGSLVSEYIATQVAPKQEVGGAVAAAWREVVPLEMAGFCRLASVARGKARVKVSSPAYMHRLETMRAELLAALQKRVGRKMVGEIKFEIGR